MFISALSSYLHSPYYQPFSIFLNQFSSYLSHAATTPHELIITGVFIIYVDDLIDTHTTQMFDLLASCNLTQHVKIHTHRHGHTLDLIISLANTTLSPIINSSYIVTSDHYPIFTNINVRPSPLPPLTTFACRNINAIHYSKFINDLHSSPLITNSLSTFQTYSTYFTRLCSPLDHYASLLTTTNKSSRTAPTAPTAWITTEILSLKTARRRLERTYIQSHSIFDLNLLRSAPNHYQKFIAAAKKSFLSSLVHSSSSNPRALEKLSTRSYTELQIAPYPHHLLWLPYLSYLPPTSPIKSKQLHLNLQTNRSSTPAPSLPSSFLLYFTLSLFHSCILTRNRQSTIAII